MPKEKRGNQPRGEKATMGTGKNEIVTKGETGHWKTKNETTKFCW